MLRLLPMIYCVAVILVEQTREIYPLDQGWLPVGSGAGVMVPPTFGGSVVPGVGVCADPSAGGALGVGTVRVATWVRAGAGRVALAVGVGVRLGRAVGSANSAGQPPVPRL